MYPSYSRRPGSPEGFGIFKLFDRLSIKVDEPLSNIDSNELKDSEGMGLGIQELEYEYLNKTFFEYGEELILNDCVASLDSDTSVPLS